MNEIIVKPGGEIDLGKRGEHMARCVMFDISGWQKTYGEGSVHLLHQRNGDSTPYPCVIDVIGSYVCWLLHETDVAVAGRGRAELQYFVGEARVKSETWTTRTDRALNNEGPVPEGPAENWLNTMLELGTQTQENAEIAEQSAEIAELSAAAAKQSAEAAKNSEAYVHDALENVVANALTEIRVNVEVTSENAASARVSSESAQENAISAEASALAAGSSEQAAKAAQTAAERARDEAQEIAGGDFATKTYVNVEIEEAMQEIDCGTF